MVNTRDFVVVRPTIGATNFAPMSMLLKKSTHRLALSSQNLMRYRLIDEDAGVRSQDQFSSRRDVGNYGCGNLKLCPVFCAVAGENVDSPRPYTMGQFDVRGVIANDKGPRKVDFMISLRNPEKIGTRLHALADVGSLMWATIDFSNRRPRIGKTLHDVLVDSVSFLRQDVAHGNPALIRHDKQHEIAKATQRRECLRVEINLSDLSKESRVFYDGSVAVKEYCWFFHMACLILMRAPG